MNKPSTTILITILFLIGLGEVGRARDRRPRAALRRMARRSGLPLRRRGHGLRRGGSGGLRRARYLAIDGHPQGRDVRSRPARGTDTRQGRDLPPTRGAARQGRLAGLRRTRHLIRSRRACHDSGGSVALLQPASRAAPDETGEDRRHPLAAAP